MESLKKFCKDESGLETVEYAVMAGLILVAVVVAVPGISGALATFFGNIADWINAHMFPVA